MEENTPHARPSRHFPTQKRELRLCLITAVISVLMADFVMYGGFHLGFAVTAIACILVSVLYLRPEKPTGYTLSLVILNVVIAASFVRSDDGFVKFVMICFLLLSGNLSLSLLSGQNRRSPNGFLSVLDAPRAFFALGAGQMGNAIGGLNDARRNAGAAGKKNMAVLTGLAIAVPVAAVLIPLLMRADAAFEGLIDQLPQINATEPVLAVFFGIPLACLLYTRSTALKHSPKPDPSTWTPKRISSLTVNTVLIAVCAVYALYLVSQLAYFIGGFSGILPDQYTMAEYARRGFFEMGWLAAINLGIITVSVALTDHKEGRTPLSTRLLCLFVGIVTLFFVSTAGAKMFMYIGSYGLTRLRVLTGVIMVFIGLSVIFVSIWLFKPGFAYMKAVVLSAMLLGAAVAWVDVDTVVAAYNVSAYQSGQLESVDISHLCQLGDGAVPYIELLTEDPDPNISQPAKDNLHKRSISQSDDIRSITIAGLIADNILERYK